MHINTLHLQSSPLCLCHQKLWHALHKHVAAGTIRSSYRKPSRQRSRQGEWWRHQIHVCVCVEAREGRERMVFFFIEGAMWSGGCVKWAMTGVTITPLADLPLLCHEQINLWNDERPGWLTGGCCERKMNDKKKTVQICMCIYTMNTYILWNCEMTF